MGLKLTGKSAREFVEKFERKAKARESRRRRREKPPVVVEPYKGRVLAFDPSSSALGWAIGESGVVSRCGVILPREPGATSDERLISRSRHLGTSAAELARHFRPDRVVVEITSGMAYKRERRHSLAALAIAQGIAVDRLHEAGYPPALVDELEWTGRKTKETRAEAIRLKCPAYRLAEATDGGLDAADACGIYLWFVERGHANKGKS